VWLSGGPAVLTGIGCEIRMLSPVEGHNLLAMDLLLYIHGPATQVTEERSFAV